MRRDDAWLLDMLLAARDAAEFASGLKFSQFDDSRLHQNAVLKAIEIVGEAASKVSDTTRTAYPDIPWEEMRNRLVHAYFEVDRVLVWRTVRDDIPALIARLTSRFDSSIASPGGEHIEPDRNMIVPLQFIPPASAGRELSAYCEFLTGRCFGSFGVAFALTPRPDIPTAGIPPSSCFSASCRDSAPG